MAIRSFGACDNAKTVLAAEAEELIMRRDTAEAVCKEVLRCCQKLDQSLGVLEGFVDPDFFCRYRRVVGETMGNLYFEVLCEIFGKYPDLEPDWMK